MKNGLSILAIFIWILGFCFAMLAVVLAKGIVCCSCKTELSIVWVIVLAVIFISTLICSAVVACKLIGEERKQKQADKSCDLLEKIYNSVFKK